jgi:hypothetical protein
MFKTLQARIMPIFSAENARKMGRAGLRQACLIIMIGLVIQLALGMILNLYVAIPAGDARASYLREIETAPFALTVHALVALLLLATAGFLLLRAVAMRDGAVIALVTTALAALLGAFAAGEIFVKDNGNGASLTMAFLTGIALLCYTSLQSVIARQEPRALDGRHVPRPRLKPSAERAETPEAPPRSPRSP